MPWLRPGLPPHVTGLAMIGSKPAQQVLIVGAADPGLAAAVGTVTGLNGRTVVVDPASGAEQAVQKAAADAGTLVEFEQGPLAPLSAATDAFDIVVLCRTLGRPEAPPTIQIAEAKRVIRSGGRVVVIQRGKPGGMFGGFRANAPGALTGDAIRDLLDGAGLAAARVLADVGGVIYIEGSKRRGG